jgi:hypothetical protein
LVKQEDKKIKLMVTRACKSKILAAHFPRPAGRFVKDPRGPHYAENGIFVTSSFGFYLENEVGVSLRHLDTRNLQQLGSTLEHLHHKNLENFEDFKLFFQDLFEKLMFGTIFSLIPNLVMSG